MSERRTKIEQLLIEEFCRNGYECFEFKGASFARLTLHGTEIAMTEVCLTRLAEHIEHGLHRRDL